MKITYLETEEIRQLAEDGETEAFEGLSIESVDAYSAVELACWKYMMMRGVTPSVSYLNTLIAGDPMLNSAVDVLMNGKIPPRLDLYTPRDWEFFPVTKSDWYNNDYHLFEGRFTAAAKRAGFGNRSAALAGALFEMVGNIIEHSGPSTKSPARGVLGYHIVEGRLTFVVGDVGRGGLSELT